MSILSSLRALLALTVLMGGVLLITVSPQAKAEENSNGTSANQSGDGYVVPQRGVGGYSLTLRDIWGPAKMPPAPKDFGPGFDFPPESLNGGPLHDPYPN